MSTSSTHRDAAPTSYPPAPWALNGQQYVSLWLVPTARCSYRLDSLLEPITVAGRYIVVTGFVDYQEGSVLKYGESFGGLVTRHPASKTAGLTITHIWVDSESSLRGGRELWGIPKELARFELATTLPGAFTAWDTTGRKLMQAWFKPRMGMRRSVNVQATSLQIRQGQVISPEPTLSCSPGLLKAEWSIPTDSPVAELGVAGGSPWMSFWARDFKLSLPVAVPIG